MSDSPVIEARAARPGFDRPVLGPLSLAVPGGARWALTGPNGSGKSLLLKCLTGQARVHGGRLTTAPGTRISLLAQDHPRPYPWPLSGHDWFRAMGTRVPEHPRIRALLRRRLDQLSGGQWQLLRLASVLAPVEAADRDTSRPHLVLLDEPANHLDAEVRADAVELITALPASATLVMTSHDDELLGALGVERHPLQDYLDAHD
ncbi:ABC transporter ATP-binding protein [Thioalkalivibrio sp. ALE11]|uniref:ATP-binding cassette domain-containing protein n=1 Tax=Thioalkalivibrio sp. ALE11 TaxID=1265494 RepID=UPI00037A0F43|nr:ABC transporter ATP-binding protein [Thioalkalivibrio sp. ALE11]